MELNRGGALALRRNTVPLTGETCSLTHLSKRAGYRHIVVNKPPQHFLRNSGVSVVADLDGKV